MPGWLDPVGGVLVVVPGVVVVLGVVCVPVVLGDVVVAGCDPVGLLAGEPVVCATATPNDRNKTADARKCLRMRLLCFCRNLPLKVGMQWPSQEMGV